MTRIVELASSSEDIQKSLARSFQSGHINFLIGSGASFPAIPPAGTVEQEIAALFDAGADENARGRMYEFLRGVQEPTNALIRNHESAGNTEAIKNYSDYLKIIEVILTERRTNLLPKQATIFSTNYDLLIERASLGYPALRLNDGFTRIPSLDGRMEFSSRTFFTTTSNSGNLYNYRVEIPCVNLIKLHGSLSWKKDKDQILFSVDPKELLPAQRTAQQTRSFVESYAVVLPQTTKFRTTLMDSTYYELLRIYANELDRENALLICFGFSFADEHIRAITKRALKNPTLRLVIFAFNEADKNTFAQHFDGYSNVEVIATNPESQITFSRFNELLAKCVPNTAGTKK